MTGRTYRNLAAAVAVIALIIGGAAGVSAQKKGGTIRVGNLGEPPTLDAHWTTASIGMGLFSSSSVRRPS